MCVCLEKRDGGEGIAKGWEGEGGGEKGREEER